MGKNRKKKGKVKAGFCEKFRYKWDKLLSKGTPALISMIIVFSITFLAIFGVLLLFIVKQAHMPSQEEPVFWNVFIHMLDPGTVTADDSGNVGYIVLMVVITLCGLVINGVLIGTISNAIDSKLASIKDGKSKIIEANHTVIIGLNDGAFTIIGELIKANENLRRGCIVVVDEMAQDKMVDLIRARIPNWKNTEIICRSGNGFEENLLETCSLASARSVIVNYEDDFSVIKQLIVISKFIKENIPSCPDFHVTSLIREEKNLVPARIICKDFGDVLYLKNTLARLIAHSCRYAGISSVFVDFFDLDGDEIYYEAFPEINGMTFGDIIMSFKNSAVMGIMKNGEPLLNPPLDTIYDYEKGDKIIHLAEDDNVSFPGKVPDRELFENLSNIIVENDEEFDSGNSILEKSQASKANGYENKKLLVLGYNQLLFDILKEFDHYIGPKSYATLVTIENSITSDIIPDFENLHFEYRTADINNYKVLDYLLDEGYDTILLLGDLNIDIKDSDAAVLSKLITLRHLIEEKCLKVNIISEMRSVENQKISSYDSDNDFIVGNNITSLILTQLSENRDLLPLFEELFKDKGAELYMRPVSNYIKIAPTTAVDMYQLQYIAGKKDEIVIGYKKFTDGKFKIELNPCKDVKVSFGEEDYLIVLAED